MVRTHLRALCGLLNLCALCLSFAVFAQQAPKVYRVAMLLAAQPARTGPSVIIFRKELRDLGYVEGQNLVIDLRSTEGKVERFPILAAELVALKPDVIVTFATEGTLAAKRAAPTIPIVMVQVSDPVGSGLISSLARPGGNITGVSDYDVEAAAKFVELAHLITPNAGRIGVLMADNPVHPVQLKAIEAAAKSIGLATVANTDRSNDDLERAFASLAKDNVGPLIVLGGARHGALRGRIAELALKYAMPTVFGSRAYVEEGGLMSYGANPAAAYKLAVSYVDKILKGAKPADLPVEQPTRFELVINLKTAKALGITIPQSLLLRADEVIE